MDFLKKLSDAIRFNDDDFDDDDDEEYYREIAKLEKKQKEKAEKAEKAESNRRNSSTLRNKDTSTRPDAKERKTTYSKDRRETGTSMRNSQNSRSNGTYVKRSSASQRVLRQTDDSSSKRATRSDNVYRLRGTKSKISFYDAKTFEDAQLVCDQLSEGVGVVVRFGKENGSECQRVMDFIAGCIYAINGNIHAASEEFFIFTPQGVELSGDEISSMIKDSGFGVPTFNKML